MGGVGEERVRVSVIRGREMNKGTLHNKNSLGEQSNKKDGSTEWKVQEAGGLSPLSTDRL